MALSAVAIKAAKSRDKPYKLADRDGLYLVVWPTGARSWKMNYRYLGKQKTLTFGRWPAVGLADARKKCDAAREVLASGEDPSEKAKLERIAAGVASASSFEAVANEYLAKIEKEGRSPVTMKKKRWLIGFIDKSIGKRAISAISAPELLLTLRKMEKKGKYETARRLRSTCSQIFRYAIATGRAEAIAGIAAEPAFEEESGRDMTGHDAQNCDESGRRACDKAEQRKRAHPCAERDRQRFCADAFRDRFRRARGPRVGRRGDDQHCRDPGQTVGEGKRRECKGGRQFGQRCDLQRQCPPSAAAPKVPSLLSRMTSIMRLRVAAPSPSNRSASPSSWKAPVASRVAATASNAAITGDAKVAPSAKPAAPIAPIAIPTRG